MADVFVSYSRRDGEFVRRLAGSIEGRGKQVWLDTEGIADGEVFPQAIRTAIEQSDAFLFVITPAAVESSYCENEVEYARELQKRIVPVLRVPVPDRQLPAEIRDRNWIPFTDRDDYEPSLERLVGALDRDLAQAKEHTRWLVKAIEWEGEGRDKSFLLRGSELKAAEAWLAASPEGAEPAPTPLQREYLLASREAAARRQRALAGASLTVALVSIGLLVFALISRGQAQSARTFAKARALAAQSQNQLAVDPELSILLGVQSVQTSPTPEGLFALRAAIDSSPLRLTLLRPGQVNCRFTNGPSLAYDPSGPRLAEGLCGGIPGPNRPLVQGRLQVFDAGNGRVISRSQVGPAGSPALAYSPDGSILAAATGDGEVHLLDARSGTARAVLGAAPLVTPGGIPRRVIELTNALVFSPKGSLLVTVTQTQAKAWSLQRHTALTLEGGTLPQSGAQGQPIPPSQLLVPLHSAAFTSDGRSVVVAGDNGARVYDARSGAMLRVLPGTSPAEAVATSPDGRQLAVASLSNGVGGGGVVSLWDPRTWGQTATLARFTAREITAVAFSPDSKELAIGAADGSAGLWSVRTHGQLVAYLGSTSRIAAIAFESDGQRLATASSDGTTKVWRAGGPQLTAIDAGGSVGDVRLVGNRLIAAMPPNVVRTWLMPGAQQQPATTSSTPGTPDGLLLSPDGGLSAEPFSTQANGPQSGIIIRSTTTGQAVRTVAPVPGMGALAISTDGRQLAMIGIQSRVADLAGARTVNLQGLGGIPGGVVGCQWVSAALTPDDRLVAAGDFCGGIAVWDARSGRLLRRFSNTGEISRIAFAPDGRHLAVGSWNSTTTIWDWKTHRPVWVLHGHTLGVDDVAYSPNGALLASASLDNTTRVWGLSTRKLLRVWRGPEPVTSVAFSSDGSQIVTADAAGTLRTWDACSACANAKALLAIARGRVTRQLTPLERTTFLSGY